MDLKTLQWRSDLCDLFDVPIEALPEIRGCADHLGDCDASLFGRALAIHGSAGDQQAALVGHGALAAGDAKITYGTGAFLVANVGDQPVVSTFIRTRPPTAAFRAGCSISGVRTAAGAIWRAASRTPWKLGVCIGFLLR